jgi:hypothetical protein
MANQDEGPLHVSWPGIVAFIVAALGLILSRPSLDSPRPTPAAADGKSITSGKGVPARLWQDPLTPVLQGQRPQDDLATVVKRWPKPAEGVAGPTHLVVQCLGAQGFTPSGGALGALAQCLVALGVMEWDAFTLGLGDVLFLLDCVDPENTPEAEEERRRERYAILSALNTAGYTPTHPDRLYSATLLRKEQPNGPVAGNGGDKRGADPNSENDLSIPYEWVERSATNNGCPYQAVCVLWVSPRPDSERQLHRLARLSRLLKKALSTDALSKGRSYPKCEFAIVGRIGSTQLGAMLREDAPPVTLYVTNSTAPSVRRNKPKASNFKLEYVIDTDKVLADRLIDELANRGINLTKRDSLAVIAEWDTDYGREMHQIFDEATFLRKKKTDGEEAYACKENVFHYSYLRGLDGKELGGASGDKKEASPDSGGEGGGEQKPIPVKPTAKEGEGEPQIDYLRRLGQRMKEEETEKGFHLRAIGIVGNDVYDKLLLLRALRPVFPNAVFFTTDLDVRLLQPGNYSDTRNLLIASHYGLSLNRCLQGGIAPFRSSYDTASYLGCLRAVKYPPLADVVEAISPADQKMRYGEAFNGNLLVPKKEDGEEKEEDRKKRKMPIHLYEVGRSGAYELTLRKGDELGPRNLRLDPWLLRGMHPWYLLGIALITSLLLYPVSRPWQRFLKSAAERGRALFPGRRTVAAAPEPDSLDWVQAFFDVGWRLVFSLALPLLVLIYLAHTSENQEPFELYEGVSAWPTVVLRLLASGLCFYYIASSLRALKKRNDDLKENFALASPRENYPGLWAGLRESCRAWTREPPKDGKVSTLCQVFAGHDVPWQRAFRTVLLASLNLGLFVLIWLLFDPTVVQARGWVAKVCYYVVLVLTLLSLAGLLMFVVDSTLLSYRFVTALAAQRERKWPGKLLAQSAKKWGLELPVAERQDVPEIWEVPRAVGQWLSIRLIDAVTYVVATRLIYYPFVVLLVLVVAQNPLFDNWHWNTPLALMAVFNTVVAVVCALLLQSAAKGARSGALSTLDELLRARGGRADDAMRENLARIRAEIEGTTTGAFAGFSQNPVVRAVLLPLVGGGGLAALEALLRYLANP